MPKLPGVNHRRATRALEKAGFRAARRRTDRDQVSLSPISTRWASRIVIIRVMGSTGDG